MNSVTRVRLEMAARVRDFVRANPIGASAGGATLERLEELLARGADLAITQQEGHLAVESAVSKRKALRKLLQGTLLRYLSSVGVVASRENAELLADFRRIEWSLNNTTFLTTVRRMLARARAVQDQLVAGGMTPGLLDDLEKGVAELETTFEASRAGRRAHVGATAELKEVITELGEVVDVLDGLVRWQFGGNARLMAVWASAKAVHGPAVRNGRGAPAAPEAGGEVAPAA